MFQLQFNSPFSSFLLKIKRTLEKRYKVISILQPILTGLHHLEGRCGGGAGGIYFFPRVPPMLVNFFYIFIVKGERAKKRQPGAQMLTHLCGSKRSQTTWGLHFCNWVYCNSLILHFCQQLVDSVTTLFCSYTQQLLLVAPRLSPIVKREVSGYILSGFFSQPLKHLGKLVMH